MPTAGAAERGNDAAGTRRSDLDWVRLALVLAAFPLSCARGLAEGGALPGGSGWVRAAGQQGIQWLLPLFFAVSGASARHSLERLGAAGFLVARVLRLFVPLAAAALVAAGLSAAGLAGTGSLEESRGWFPWYLAGAFAFSLLLPPLRRLLAGKPGIDVPAVGAVQLPAPGAGFAGTLLLLIAAAAAAAALPVLPGIPQALAAGGWGVCFYAVAFLLGFLVHHAPRLRAQAVRLHVAWLAVSGVFLAGTAAAGRLLPGLPSAVGSALRGAASCTLCLALLGAGADRLSAARAVPRAVREASLPFSILAQPAAGILAAAAVGWQAPAGVKLVVLVPAAFIAVGVLYAAVRRVTVLRFCLGLTPLQTQGGRHE